MVDSYSQVHFADWYMMYWYYQLICGFNLFFICWQIRSKSRSKFVQKKNWRIPYWSDNQLYRARTARVREKDYIQIWEQLIHVHELHVHRLWAKSLFVSGSPSSGYEPWAGPWINVSFSGNPILSHHFLAKCSHHFVLNHVKQYSE